MFAASIELASDAEGNAFAAMMAELIRQNAADHPDKLRTLASMRGRVTLIAVDAASTVTLHFGRGRLTVHGGLFGVPDLVVRGTSEALIDLSRIPKHPRLRFLPDLRAPAARSIARALVARELRIGGLRSHPRLALKLAHVLAID